MGGLQTTVLVIPLIVLFGRHLVDGWICSIVICLGFFPNILSLNVDAVLTVKSWTSEWL
jgi:hypothetical protein